MSIETIATLAAAIVAIITFGFGVVAYLWRRWYTRLRYRRIKSRSDWAWGGIKRLHEIHFTEDVRDDIEDMKRWIEEWRKKSRKSGIDLEEILIVAQVNLKILGYLYGQYYTSLRYAFISYYGIDRKSDIAREHAAELLLEGLFTETAKYKYLRGIVSELEEYVEEESVDEIGAVQIKKRKHAPGLFRNFHDAIRNVNLKHRTHLKVYRLMADYYQPLLREEDLDHLNSSYGISDFRQWLVIIPNQRLATKEINKEIFISRQDASKIFEFIFLKLYWDAFETTEYREYLKSELRRHTEGLPDQVQILDDYRKLAKMLPDP